MDVLDFLLGFVCCGAGVGLGAFFAYLYWISKFEDLS